MVSIQSSCFSILFISVHRFDDGRFFPNSMDGGPTVCGVGEGAGRTIQVAWNGVSPVGSCCFGIFLLISIVGMCVKSHKNARRGKLRSFFVLPSRVSCSGLCHRSSKITFLGILYESDLLSLAKRCRIASKP